MPWPPGGSAVGLRQSGRAAKRWNTSPAPRRRPPAADDVLRACLPVQLSSARKHMAAADDSLFSYVRPESQIPSGHSLRLIRHVADETLSALSDQFAMLYSENGRPSIPPEQLLRALLLQAFYSSRSEWQLTEQLNYSLLFHWSVRMSVDDPVWVPTVSSKNRDRLLEGDIAATFMDALLNLSRVKALLSDEHFSVNGTLIQAWGSMKSFRRRDGNDEPPAPGRNGERNFHEEKRSSETHASTTDPDARLARKFNGDGANWRSPAIC